MASAGAHRAARKIEDLGSNISDVTGDTFGASATIGREGRLNAFGYGVSGPNVKVQGNLRNITRNVNRAIRTSSRLSKD